MKQVTGPGRATRALASLAVFATLVAPARSQGPLEPDLRVETFEAAWRIIYDQHFDPSFNGVDWLAVKEDLLPRVRAAEGIDEARDLIREMLACLDQSHFSLVEHEFLGDGEKSGVGSPAGTVGFDVRVRGSEVIVSRVEPEGSADAAGVQPGWLLTEIGGNTIDSIREEFPASTTLRESSAHWSELHLLIDGDVGTRATFRFVDGNGGVRDVELERVDRDAVPYDLPGLPTFYLTSRTERIERDGLSVGVLHFSNWFRGISAAIDVALADLRDCDGIVIDLRGNSGGDAMMAGEVAGHFFDEPGVLGTQRMRASDFEYRYRPRRRIAGREVDIFDGPLVIVTDETTGSCSELFSGGMQALGRAVVIGEVTAGAALPATLTELPNRDFLLHAVGDFLTAEGKSLERHGVRPDVRAPLDRAALLEGRDATMDAAVNWIDRELAG